MSTNTTIDLWEDSQGLHVHEPETEDQKEVALDVEVDFDYQPEEARTWEYPGCDASVEVNSVTEIVAKGKEGRDLSFVLEDEDIKGQLEEACFDELNSQEEAAAEDRYERNRED